MGQITITTGDIMKASEIAKHERRVAQKLKDLRVERGLSQGELAKKSGLDRKTVNRIENGRFSPSLDTLIRVCSTMSVTVSEVVK